MGLKRLSPQEVSPRQEIEGGSEQVRRNTWPHPGNLFAQLTQATAAASAVRQLLSQGLPLTAPLTVTSARLHSRKGGGSVGCIGVGEGMP